MVRNSRARCRSGHSPFDYTCATTTNFFEETCHDQDQSCTEIATERDLERVVEPLASFICATDRPRAALHLGPGDPLQRSGADQPGSNRTFRDLSENHWS